LLHYCRGIWAREDNEQRLLRYRKEGRTVPMFWQGPSMQGSLDASQFQPFGPGTPVDEVITDMQPIGFTGNYVVFELKPIDSDADDVSLDPDSENGNVVLPLAELLNIVRSAYADPSGSALRDPAFDAFLDEAEALLIADPKAFKKISDDTVFDFVSFLSALSSELVDSTGKVIRQNGELVFSIGAEQWAEYLFRRNATRRFLVDSNNLYVSLLLGQGVALEPFKRAHRFIDVLKAEEERKAAVIKNTRRDLLKEKELTFDPDIEKVVVVGGASVQDVVGGVIRDPDNDNDA
jgi:hypothetical protein